MMSGATQMALLLAGLESVRASMRASEGPQSVQIEM